VTERYAPKRPFPPYAYLPGGALPHPTQNPEGHSYTGGPGEEADYYEPTRWRDNDDYLFGVDLYNHGYLWEAHEVWEGLWHKAKPDAVQADLLQGLIQCAAAALKVPMQQPGGLAKLARVGTERLENVARRGGPDYMGLDLFDFVREFRAFAGGSPQSADERPRLVLEAE
jgi:hypothetical protein